MDSLRKPFQGVWNIIRFNWHFYLFATVVALSILLLQHFLSPSLTAIAYLLVLLIIGSMLVSLLVSCYIYDFSGLYTLAWLDDLQSHEQATIINIHAGFDETSLLLQQKFASANLLVADFYDPDKHTEVSIKRARNAYPPFRGTQQISTLHLPYPNSTTDKVFTILSAHEIRNDIERISFFQEVHRVLKPAGHIVVTEHLRDTANFLAYSIGFFHFHSRATWLTTFRLSGLTVIKEIKITPFITSFILQKNGTAS